MTQMFAAVLDHIPTRATAMATFGGAIAAVVAPVADSPATGWAGLATILVGGALHYYRMRAEDRKADAARQADASHRDDCHERLKAVEARFDRLFDERHPTAAPRATEAKVVEPPKPSA